MQGHPPDHLNVEVTQTQRPLTGLANHRERFRQQLIQGFPLLKALFEFRCLGRQGLITERFQLAFHLVDFGDCFAHTLQFALVLRAEQGLH